MHLSAAEFEHFQATIWSNKVYSNKVSKLLVDSLDANLSKFKKRRTKQLNIKKLTNMLINENSWLIKWYWKWLTAVIQYLWLFFSWYVWIDTVINAVRKIENIWYKKSLWIEDITFIPEIEDRIQKIDNILWQICNYKWWITNFVLLILEFQDIFSQGTTNSFNATSWLAEMCDKYVNMKMEDLYFDVNNSTKKENTSDDENKIIDKEWDKVDSFDKISQIVINHKQITTKQLQEFFLPNSISPINWIAQDYLNMIKWLIMILEIACLSGNFDHIWDSFRKSMKSIIRYKEFYWIQDITFISEIEDRIQKIDHTLNQIVHFQWNLSDLCLLIIEFYKLVLWENTKRFREMLDWNLKLLYADILEIEKSWSITITLK